MPYSCRTEVMVDPAAMARSRSWMKSSERYVQPLSCVVICVILPPVAHTITNTRVLAVDWSGDALHAERRIWLAEASDPRILVRLANGRNGDGLATWLLDEAAKTPRRVIG